MNRIFSLISGKLIDRFSALKLLPYHLTPFLAGLLVLILSDHALAAPIYLTLTGITMGLSSTVKTAQTYRPGTSDILSISQLNCIVCLAEQMGHFLHQHNVLRWNLTIPSKLPGDILKSFFAVKCNVRWIATVMPICKLCFIG